ncbi:maleylpyruvate isomerase family mycothiol-dependent enzyme [Streptomyces sp. NPDC006649]|uniref:maleylpyruvate isomerase family mycothiol-dependent enzyme n=1 Tax=Streptomyces sp. NPDC006649 TaxID=3156896 RepID=UPI0033BB746E
MEIREPELPRRLLLTERAALMPLLRRTPEELFSRRTACPDWNVRQVLAHCGAALARIVEGRLEQAVFSPESNAADVAERDAWPLRKVLDELDWGMAEAGVAIAAREDGLLDTVALGEWVHAGDVRDAFGEPGAYGGDSTDSALTLIGVASRRRGNPLVHATLPGRDAALVLGVGGDGRPPAQLTADAATLVRLCTGRPLKSSLYELSGAREEELYIYD